MNRTDIKDKEMLELAKHVLELADKTPQLIKLQVLCREIAQGQRKDISKKVIDDAFDIIEIFIKEACDTPDDISHVQKLAFRNIAYQMFLNQNICIHN